MKHSRGLQTFPQGPSGEKIFEFFFLIWCILVYFLFLSVDEAPKHRRAQLTLPPLHPFDGPDADCKGFWVQTPLIVAGGAISHRLNFGFLKYSCSRILYQNQQLGYVFIFLTTVLFCIR